MPPTVTQERSVGCRLRRDPAQVSQARRLVRETLAEWGLDGYIDHAVLIGSADESGRGLAVIDGLISMYDGHRGCTDDRTGPGKTVYVVLPLITNAAGAW